MRHLRALLATSVLAGVIALVSPTLVSSATAASDAVAISSSHCAANRAAGQITFVSPFGYDASAGIIDIFAAKSLGYFSALCLNVAVTIPPFTTSAYEIVSSGRGTVSGEGSAADTLVEIANGSNLVGISTFADTSDYALLTAPSVTNLRQLAGKTLGYHTVLPVVISEMLHNAGLAAGAVHEVNDLSYDPTLLVQNKFQALQAYQSNEPLELEAAGFKSPKAFREWLPSSLGVAGTFNVQVMNASFLKAHRQAAGDFLRADLRAVAYCIAHQAACVAIEQAAAGAAHVSYDRSHALAEWAFESGLIEHHSLTGQGIGVQSAAEWKSEASAVLAYKLVKHAPDLSSALDSRLAASLYQGTKLIWP